MRAWGGFNMFLGSSTQNLLNQMKIMSESNFWIRNLQNLMKSLSLEMSSGSSKVQDLSCGGPGRQVLAS